MASASANSRVRYVILFLFTMSEYQTFLFLFLNYYLFHYFSYWKQLWRWTTSESLEKDDLAKVLSSSEVIQGLRQGLDSYKPNRSEDFAKLQTKHTDQAKLLNVVQTLQNYIVSTYICIFST